MYTNKIGCTVFARTVGKDRMEQYVRHFFPAIYWEDMKGQSQSGTSMKQQDSVLCIIPAASVSGYVPKRSDRIFCGRCTAGGMPDGHGSERLSLWLCRRAASGGDGSMIIKVGIHFNTKQLHAKSAALKQQAQEFVGNELLRKCDPYVPFDTGMLRDSGISHSKPAEGYLLWKTPYAAVQWYAGVSRGLRGKKWALRAWADHGKLILKSARSIAKGKV